MCIRTDDSERMKQKILKLKGEGSMIGMLENAIDIVLLVAVGYLFLALIFSIQRKPAAELARIRDSAASRLRNLRR